MKNRHRGRSKGRFLKVVHYQHEYNELERSVQDRFGSAPAQMMYFARLLREKFDSPVTYRLFTDRRWDSLPGVIMAKKLYNVSFTATVNKKSRYHIISYWCKKGSPVVAKSKARNRRGKYRSATTAIDGVTLNTCLWNDSNLLGGVSADLGTENRPVTRRMGRHLAPISCPTMMFVRNKFLRGVDVNDQLRACKWQMVLICRTKAWPKLAGGLFEMLVVNIHIVKRQCRDWVDDPCQLRWTIVQGMVDKAAELEVDSGHATSDDVSSGQDTSCKDEGKVPRFEGADLHHWELLDEYVTPEEAEKNAKIVAKNPSGRELSRCPRQRDKNRLDGKVRNPLWTSASVCLVCKYQHGIRKETNRFCRECCVDDLRRDAGWPSTNRAQGFAKAFHPRLCSRECFNFFHTHTVRGLDYAQKRQRSKGSTNSKVARSRNSADATPSPVIQTPAVSRSQRRGARNSSKPRTTKFDV